MVARCDCGYCFVTPPADNNVPIPGSTPNAAAKLPRLWIGFVLGVATFLSEMVEVAINPDLADQKNPIGFYLIVSIAAWIYWLHCVFRYHDIMTSIPGYTHSITPGQAVARHFFPIYNFYWMFKWPMEVGTFIKWRMQKNTMRGRIAGTLVLLAIIFARTIDGGLGILFLFGAGVYISKNLRRAFSAPPVPPSAMERPGNPLSLGLT
jgi:hypothetical protein